MTLKIKHSVFILITLLSQNTSLYGSTQDKEDFVQNKMSNHVSTSVPLSVKEVNAQYHLGGSYYTGESVFQNYTEAFKCFHKAAEQGNADAQFSIAMMCYRGEGTIQDYKQAMAWFKKAGKQGHAEACQNVGVMYRDGQGVMANLSKAMEWCLKSVNITNNPSK